MSNENYGENIRHLGFSASLIFCRNTISITILTAK